jgi:ADP-ribosyl-[dinitrogen reductase] hydrolase
MAVGDSIGLPYEGTRPRKFAGRQSFFAGWGITSDDAQHAALTLRALELAQGDPERFRQALGRGIALWFLCLPPGIGLATLRSAFKLCAGLRAPASGVFSAGNGPAMRAPVLGWEIADPARLEEFVRISTTTTHTDPKAQTASLALARTLQHLRRHPSPTRADLLTLWRSVDNAPYWQSAVDAIEAADSTAALLAATGQTRGIGGYILHTVPAALFIAERHRTDFRAAISETVLAGGDTDTAAAIVAALCAGFGAEPPPEWLRIVDYPLRREPGLHRLGWNLLCTALILLWHVPKRLLRL